jgi:phosphatidate cytidylyltransferase
MRTRVISAAAGIVLLAGVVYLGKEAIGIAIFVLALIAIYEFDKVLEKGGFKPVYVLGYLSCLPLLYLAVADLLPESLTKLSPASSTLADNSVLAASLGIFLLLTALFCFIIFSNGKYTITDIAFTLFGIIYVVFLFSFVTLTRNMEKGHLYIWLIFIGAWATDTFAYFTGVSIGKTKILPKISPKKSLEGCIGGVIGCIIIMMLFGQVFYPELGIQIIHFAVLGLICAIISQIGDWSASAIKRAVGVKDYGNIMPGHGGVLDRLDSILFTAPVVYFYISMFF